MTTRDVDPEIFYAVGRGLFEKAGVLFGAFSSNVAVLNGTGAMAGTDDAGTAWAASYDSRVCEVLSATNDLIAALENYGGVVIQAGHLAGQAHRAAELCGRAVRPAVSWRTRPGAPRHSGVDAPDRCTGARRRHRQGHDSC